MAELAENANSEPLKTFKFPVKLATHNGTFHYDEVLATAMLEVIYGDVTLVRSRDANELRAADIVYDVGGVFEPAKNRFDHHQITFKDTYSPQHTVRLSSCGLIYKYFCNELFAKYNFDREHTLYAEIKAKIYDEFFLYADALDNGVEIFGQVHPRTLGSLVAGFNVYLCKDESQLEALQNAQFRKALDIVKVDFLNYIDYIFNDYVKNYMLVHDELVNYSGEIYITGLKVPASLILSVDGKLEKGLKLVIYKYKHDYRALALPLHQGTFKTRAPLPAAWRGYKDKELSKISGIPGCIFVHATGFTGGNKTLDGAIAMCEAALTESTKKTKLPTD